MIRRRNRPDLALRSLACDLAILSSFDGSARFCQGTTIVLCGIQGPVEHSAGRSNDPASCPLISCSVKYMSTATADSSQHDLAELESMISGSLQAVISREVSSSTQITVSITVLDDDGALISTALNAAYMALVDASIPCRSILTSVTLACSEQGRVLIDPTDDENKKSLSKLTLAFSHCDGRQSDDPDIVLSHGDGVLLPGSYFQLIEHARSAAQQVLAFQVMTLRSRALQTLT